MGRMWNIENSVSRKSWFHSTSNYSIVNLYFIYKAARRKVNERNKSTWSAQKIRSQAEADPDSVQQTDTNYEV